MLSECSCSVQRVRRAIFRKTPSWATSVINLVGTARKIDRTGLKILGNYKTIQSIISVNANILLRRFRLKFLRTMYSTWCYKERLNLKNTLYKKNCKTKNLITFGKSKKHHLHSLPLRLKKVCSPRKRFEPKVSQEVMVVFTEN
jgi:hypothetical protein